MGKLADLLLTEEEQNPKPEGKIFCDMDGVLTDFDERFEHYFGTPPGEYEKKHGTAGFWDAIRPLGVSYWAGMQWTPNGKQLWDFIKDFDPILLTAPSREDESRIGKSVWVKKHLSPKPKVMFKFSKYKQEALTSSEDILIDDREDNIQRWRDAGGIGILHPKNGDPSGVIERLKKLGYGKSPEEGI